MTTESLNKRIENSLSEHWDRPSMSNYQGETLTYGEAAAIVKKLQMAFEKCGIVKGDKIALCAKNQVHWGCAFLAALTYGAVPVPLLHEFKPENIHYLVNHSQAKAFFVDESIWEGLNESEMSGLSFVMQMNDYSVLYAKDDGVKSVLDGLDASFAEKYPSFGPSDLEFYEDRPEELAMINYTSGTSGFSKGVMLPYRALLSNMNFAQFTAEPQMSSKDSMVSLLPSAHMYGLTFEFLFEITIGAHVYFLNRVPSPKIIQKAFCEIHPAIVIAVPLIMEKVYKNQIKPRIDKYKALFNIPIVNMPIRKKVHDELVASFGGNFEEVILGGAAFNPEVERFLRKIGFPFTVGYGMTECAPIITYAKWNRTKEGSCGVPVPGCRIRIDSKDPLRIPGEVQVKGDNVFLGYYKNKDATKQAFTNDGWFKTGDMGVVDNDGYLFLRGRSKCMILGPSGQNIYPEELEAVINSMRYVIESLVIEENGALTALMFLDYKLGQSDGYEDAAQLEEKIRESLPELNKRFPVYAQIRRIEFMPEDFERTPKKSIKRYLYQRN